MLCPIAKEEELKKRYNVINGEANNYANEYKEIANQYLIKHCNEYTEPSFMIRPIKIR